MKLTRDLRRAWVDWDFGSSNVGFGDHRLQEWWTARWPVSSPTGMEGSNVVDSFKILLTLILMGLIWPDPYFHHTLVSNLHFLAKIHYLVGLVTRPTRNLLTHPTFQIALPSVGLVWWELGQDRQNHICTPCFWTCRPCERGPSPSLLCTPPIQDSHPPWPIFQFYSILISFLLDIFCFAIYYMLFRY